MIPRSAKKMATEGLDNALCGGAEKTETMSELLALCNEVNKGEKNEEKRF